MLKFRHESQLAIECEDYHYFNVPRPLSLILIQTYNSVLKGMDFFVESVSEKLKCFGRKLTNHCKD